MSGKGGAGGILGGILAIIGVVVVIGAKVYRAEMRAERREKSSERAATLESECFDHAHEMMDRAPDVARVGEYLHWGVRTFHDQAWIKAGEGMGGATGPAYRDALLDLIYAAAAKEGRESEVRSLEKIKLYSRVAGEKWWEIKKS